MVVGLNSTTANNQLTYASLPYTITNVQSGFRNLYYTLEVDVDFSNISYVGDLAFSGSQIYAPSGIEFTQGVSVGNSAFYDCTFTGSNYITLTIDYADSSSLDILAFANTNISYIQLNHESYLNTDICTVDGSTFNGCDISYVQLYNKAKSYYTQDENWQETGLTFTGGL